MAADDVAVAEGVAVLAGAEGDAGLGGENVLQVGLAGFLHQGLGQHADGLRGFRQVLDPALVAGDFCLVGRAFFGVGVGVRGALLDLQGIQHDGVILGEERLPGEQAGDAEGEGGAGGAEALGAQAQGVFRFWAGRHDLLLNQ